MVCSPEILWSTGNVSEACPGVPTPLSWDIQGKCIAIAARHAFVELGIVPRKGDALHPDLTLMGIFHGHPVGSVTATVRAIAALPGSTVGGVTEHMFGQGAEPPPGITDTKVRYPVVALRAPATVALLPRRVRRWERRARDFQDTFMPAGGASADASRKVLRAGRDLFTSCINCQGLATFIGQGLYEQVAALATAAGMPGKETQLVSGYGTLAESHLAAKLWEVAAGRANMEDFLAEYGHHAPDEGELSSRSWREDPTPIRRTLETIKDLPESEHADNQVQRQAEQREHLERQLLANLPKSKRRNAKLVLRIAKRYVPLREICRGMMHRVFDTMRAHARNLGERLTEEGRLPDADAVFYLELDELLGPLPADVSERVAFRRERRAHYQTLDVPALFRGVPGKTPRRDLTAGRTVDVTELQGTAIAPGRVDGLARVVFDPAAEEEPTDAGEVLVCHITDPSWISLMIGAGALVTDVGGAMSHAAIIARELGIPCVVATGNGTAAIRTGDRLLVDGAAGTVEILERKD